MNLLTVCSNNRYKTITENVCKNGRDFNVQAKNDTVRILISHNSDLQKFNFNNHFLFLFYI